MMNHCTASTVADLLSKFALELAFAAPGGDSGLLPMNSFLMKIEDLAKAPAVPAQIVAATGQARQWLDRVFETTATFDADALVRLGSWQAWMESAAEKWAQGSPVPELPASWEGAPAGQKSPASGNADEPELILHAEADRELLAEFINESQEHLQNIEQGVLVLEENPADADTLNSIFRAFHTFKGGAGFLNLTAIKDLAHELESLLDAARLHRLEVTSGIIDVILEGGDRLTEFVRHIQTRLAGGDASAPIRVPTLCLIARVKSLLSDPGAPVAFPAPRVVEAVETFSFAPAEPVPVGVAKVDAPAARPSTGAASGDSAAGFVKVDTHKLDSLIEIVGELVIAQSMVVQDAGVRDLVSQELTRNLAQLRRTTNDLQRTAMSLRMVPIRNTFQKMTRLVRDLAAKQQKQVRLVMNGEDTELDRTIVGELSDPLIHMIRNSVDHGIERPDARIARGKPAEGIVELSAFHQGGSIVIQIRDDGDGLNKERILAKAIENGLVKPDAALSDSEIFGLIFAAGFSTAEAITDISGRGVGMDVVRRNIENLRGKIEITSTPGEGTTFTISLPLTLAIIDGLIVGVGPERYIIPTLSVRESFRPTPEMLSTVYGRGEMVNVRGRLTPLLRLHRHFNIEARVANPTEGILVVVESGADRRCVMVDDLLGKQEVVIKSLGEQFKRNGALAGGAILGDGRVGLILNVDALVKLEEPDTELAA